MEPSVARLGITLTTLALLALTFSIIGAVLSERGRYSFFNPKGYHVSALYLQREQAIKDSCYMGKVMPSNWSSRVSVEQELVKCHEDSSHQFAILSKRSGLSLLLPTSFFNDPAFPFVYTQLRNQLKLRFPYGEIRYLELYMNRHYVGPYVRVDLPLGKNFKSSTPYELLTISGNQMRCVSSDLEQHCPYYKKLISNGTFPKLSATPELTVVHSFSSIYSPQKTFLLDGWNSELLPFPFPVDLVSTISILFNKKKPLFTVTDFRFEKLIGEPKTVPISLDFNRALLHQQLRQLQASNGLISLIRHGMWVPESEKEKDDFYAMNYPSIRWIMDYSRH